VERSTRVARKQAVLAHNLPREAAQTTILRRGLARGADHILRHNGFEAHKFIEKLWAMRNPLLYLGLGGYEWR
jgi:hypothetical protein